MQSNNVNPDEISKFNELASSWWDPTGPMKPLHQFNPPRLAFIQQFASLQQQRILDIGCGGGLLAEAMAQAGANVTAIDQADSLITAAKLHALEGQLSIDYQVIPSEILSAEQPHSFDVVTCMELLEHVPDPGALVRDCAQLVKPGGKVFFSTLDRNAKAYFGGILMAEYVLRLLPAGTHQYQQFIRPDELAGLCRAQGLKPIAARGIDYSPFTGRAQLSTKININYLLVCEA